MGRWQDAQNVRATTGRWQRAGNVAQAEVPKEKPSKLRPALSEFAAGFTAPLRAALSIGKKIPFSYEQFKEQHPPRASKGALVAPLTNVPPTTQATLDLRRGPLNPEAARHELLFGPTVEQEAATERTRKRTERL